MADPDSLPESPRSPLTPDTLTSVTALARFEFESGRGNEGTKILMVEWEDEDKRRTQSAGTWAVGWSGKSTSIPADERPSERIRRLYFLLPPQAPVPPHLTLTYQPPNAKQQSEPLKMTVYPLPAIFTPDLGASAQTSGMKGVLHTIWGKKRLQVLEKEIRREQEFNLEGIALEMAKSERAWIESNFGVQYRPSIDLGIVAPRSPTGPTSPALQSPRSPGGRRLSEKLKGLSIATDDRSLRAKANTPIKEEHPLSPEESDVAYSSFKSFRNGPLSPTSGRSRKVVAQAPPKSVRQMQKRNSLGLHAGSRQSEEDTADDLFAKALSPRSPDDPKSPFSFTSEEVSQSPYAKIKGSPK